MASLYEISQEFINIFNEIEENEGELTPELEEKLAITRGDYAQKLENYAQIVNQYKADIFAIKAEKERLDRRKKSLERRIDILENRMLDAITEFGPVETATFKIGTRKSKSIELDEERITTLRNTVLDFARDAYNNAVIIFGEYCDVDGILEVVNAHAKADYIAKEKINPTGYEFVPYTKDDLAITNVNVNTRSSLMNLFTNKDSVLKAMLEDEGRFNIDNDTSKTEFKNQLEVYSDTTIGKLKENVKLSIK